jgi:hypothetical protein
MYTPEELFTIKMLNFHWLTVPQRYDGVDGFYTGLAPQGYVFDYDRFDPYLVQEIVQWIKGPEVIRSAKTIGNWTASNCNVISTEYSNENGYKVEVELTSDLYASIESTEETFPVSDQDNWFLTEFIVDSSNSDITVVHTGGNINMDCAGGVTGPFASFDEPQYDDGHNTQVYVPQKYVPNAAWQSTNLHIGFRGGKAGDRIRISNLGVYKVTMA